MSSKAASVIVSPTLKTQVYAPIHCPVFVFRRVCCKPFPASMDGVANLVAEGLALDERLIFQSFSKKSLSGTLSRMTIYLALLGNECDDYCYETQDASPTSSIHGVAGMVVEWLQLGSFGPSQRMFHVSWRTSSSAECGTLSRKTVGPCSHSYLTQGNASTSCWCSCWVLWSYGVNPEDHRSVCRTL